LNADSIVVNGFSKSHAMTGLRLGYAHGPSAIIDAMIQLQQFTYVCAPQPCQWAGLVALETGVSQHVADYRRKRDIVAEGLRDHFDLVAPGGAFFAFPKVPWGTGEEFAHKAIEHNVLVIPGKVFSRQDTHFRISMAVSDDKLRAGIDALVKLAQSGPR
jgi:aspartate aminotransferase/aminotransferase